MTLKYSCEDLQGSIYFGPNALRHCCQRFFVNGQRRGDVEILKVSKDDDLNIKKIIKEKKKIIKDLNEKTPNPCDGCPKIQLREWAEKIKINKISIEANSKCNARCSYCSEMFYGGLNPNYNLETMLTDFKKNHFFENEVSVTWGGGEPVLLPHFDHIFKKFITSSKPKFNDFRVYSNSIIYNKSIHKYLNEKKIILTTSTDAGTQKTFEKVRGVKKGFLNIFKNLKKYNEKKPGNIIIKYILTEDNYSKKEIDSFINLIKEYELTNCNFEISTDYKFEKLDLKKTYSVIYFFNALKSTGANFVHFDDHIRKRIFTTLQKEITIEDLDKENIFKDIRKYFNKKIIVWGTGRYAEEVTKKSFLFKKSEIAFFVDKYYLTKKNRFIKSEVKNPEKIHSYDYPIFIASSTYWHQIFKHIIAMGISEKRIINTMVI